MFSLRPLPPTISGHEPFYLVATGLHTGRIRPASGSWGSLAAWPLCYALKLAGGVPLLLLFALVAGLAGIWSIRRYSPHATQKDPSEIVIDEVVGMALMWLFIPVNGFFWALAGFVLFRLLDSLKPGPIGWCDRKIGGAHGVIIDDIIAGLVAGLVILALRLVF